MSDNYFEEADDGRNWRRKAFEALLAHPALSLRQRRVALVIIKRCDKEDWCAYPSVRRIAFDSGYDRRTVKTILAEICADDGKQYPKDRSATIFIREPGQAGRGNVAIYHLRWDWVEETLAPFEERYEAALPEEPKRAGKTRPFNNAETGIVKGGETPIKGGNFPLKGGKAPRKRATIQPPESLNPLNPPESSLYARPSGLAHKKISPQEIENKTVEETGDRKAREAKPHLSPFENKFPNWKNGGKAP